jgi:hypothetical protein
VIVTPVVSAIGSAKTTISTCVAGPSQAPSVSVTQYEVFAVGTGGVNGLEVLTTVVRAASEYQVTVPPVVVTVIGPTGLPLQTLIIVLAMPGAAGVGLIVSVILSVTDEQAPVGSSVVIYRTTLPAAISAAEGVYTAFKVPAPAKDPVPPEVQVKLVALPPIESPVIVYVSPAQIAASGPASTSGATSTVTAAESMLIAHPPAAAIVL